MQIQRLINPQTGGFYDPMTGQITIHKNTPEAVAHEFKHYTDVTNEGLIQQENNYSRYNKSLGYWRNPYEMGAYDYGKWFGLFRTSIAY